MTEAEPSERGITVVALSHAEVPHRPAKRDVDVGHRLSMRPAGEGTKRHEEAVKICAISDDLKGEPDERTGDHRIAIARSITRNAKVVQCDEPASSLDAAPRKRMRRQRADIHHRLGTERSSSPAVR